MRDHADIIKTAGVEAVVEATTASNPAVRSWIFRKGIPAEHWKVFADHGWATLEELAETVKPRERKAA